MGLLHTGGVADGHLCVQQLSLDFKAYTQSKGIVYMSFSTICDPCPVADIRALLAGDLVPGIGRAHNKTGSQVPLRWAVQQGIPVVPQSSTAVHIREDFDIFDFNCFIF